MLTCALGPDSAGTLVTAALRRAERSIDAAVYEVGPSYAWVLATAARRGLHVRLLLDAHASDGNAATAAVVVRNGGECRVLGGGMPVAHWKVIVVDGATVTVGTGNLVWRDAPRDHHGRLPPEATALHGTREWWALAGDVPGLALDARLAFEAAWDRATPVPRRWMASPSASPGDVGTPTPQVAPRFVDVDGARVRLVVGGMPVALALGRLVQGSRHRVLITAPYVHPRAAGVRWLAGAARARSVRGADVRILLGDRPRPADAAWLLATGIEVRWMDADLSTRGHAKGVIGDDTTAITSANWSGAGFGCNWEAALLARSEAAAEYYAAAYERDWAVAATL